MQKVQCMQGISDGAEQWCPVQGGGCVLEVTFNRGFAVSVMID